MTPKTHLHHNDLPEGISFGDAVAIDTETMGLNPHRDRLCLVQLSAGDGTCHMVKFDKTYEAPNLKKLLGDPAVTKIFHFARFDLAVLAHFLKVMPAPVYCTKIASKLTRTYGARHGLKDLCSSLLNITLNKEQQASNWGDASLTKAQLSYAASDVLYLHKLKEKLDILLKREGRLEMAHSSFNFLPTVAQMDLLGWDVGQMFSHA